MGNGLASFQRRMRAIPEAVARGVESDLIRAAQEIADTQQALAPRLTGAMALSIDVTGPGQATPPYSQPGGSYAVPLSAAAVTVGGPDVRYPHLVEHGTRNAPAQPFFWPGFRLSRDRAGKIMVAAIRRHIRGAK